MADEEFICNIITNDDELTKIIKQFSDKLTKFVIADAVAFAKFNDRNSDEEAIMEKYETSKSLYDEAKEDFMKIFKIITKRRIATFKKEIVLKEITDNETIH